MAVNTQIIDSGELQRVEKYTPQNDYDKQNSFNDFTHLFSLNLLEGAHGADRVCIGLLYRYTLALA